MSRELPSQGMCLWLSQMYWEMKPQTKRNRELSNVHNKIQQMNIAYKKGVSK